MKACMLLAVVLLAGCGGSGGGDETRIRLVVPDENVREEGIECAGARPYQHVHPGAPYTIEADGGDVVAEGELPIGRAENARPGVHWGVERIPTFCVLVLDVELPRGLRYRFRVDGGRPLEFEPGDEPITLVVS